MAKAWLRRSARQALMYMENLMVRCRLLPVIMNCSAACGAVCLLCATSRRRCCCCSSILLVLLLQC